MNELQNVPNPPAERLPAGRGLTWLVQSLALIRIQPARLLFLAVLLQLILGLSQVPVLGMLVILALPAFSAGLLAAFRCIETGRPLPASILFVPLTRRPANGRFLMLGVLMFAVAAISVMLAMGGSDAQVDPELLQRIEQGDAEAIAMLDPALTSTVLFAALLAVSISGTISFLAIPLIWFHDMPMAKAVVSGLRGMQLNWKPFLVLGLGLMALLLPLALFFGMMIAMAGTLSPLSLILVILVMISGLLFQLVVLATQFYACKDIFGLGKDSDSVPNLPEDKDDGQLLA